MTLKLTSQNVIHLDAPLNPCHLEEPSLVLGTNLKIEVVSGTREGSYGMT